MLEVLISVNKTPGIGQLPLPPPAFCHPSAEGTGHSYSHLCRAVPGPPQGQWGHSARALEPLAVSAHTGTVNECPVCLVGKAEAVLSPNEFFVLVKEGGNVTEVTLAPDPPVLSPPCNLLSVSELHREG